MTRVPDEFSEAFEDKGETFFEIAELLYTHPGRQYTQDELAEKVDLSNTRISDHTTEMTDSDWLNRHENQTTFTWNTDAHNPADTEGVAAIRMFYIDFWILLKKHARTVPGAYAIVGFVTILSAVVMFAFYIGFSLRITQESSIPTAIYFTIALGSFLTGVIVTFLSPLQAVVNRFMWRRLPESLFQKD